MWAKRIWGNQTEFGSKAYQDKRIGMLRHLNKSSTKAHIKRYHGWMILSSRKLYIRSYKFWVVEITRRMVQRCAWSNSGWVPSNSDVGMVHLSLWVRTWVPRFCCYHTHLNANVKACLGRTPLSIVGSTRRHCCRSILLCGHQSARNRCCIFANTYRRANTIDKRSHCRKGIRTCRWSYASGHPERQQPRWWGGRKWR